VKESLAARKLQLEASIVERKIESYAANANDNQLGLSQQEYDDLQRRVTAVIHVSHQISASLRISDTRGLTECMAGQL